MGEFDTSTLKFVSKVEQIDLSKHVAVNELGEEDVAMLNAVRKLQKSEIDKYVSRNSPFQACGKTSSILRKKDCLLKQLH